jgi:hypothetical protein
MSGEVLLDTSSRNTASANGRKNGPPPGVPTKAGVAASALFEKPSWAKHSFSASKKFGVEVTLHSVRQEAELDHHRLPDEKLWGRPERFDTLAARHNRWIVGPMPQVDDLSRSLIELNQDTTW